MRYIAVVFLFVVIGVNAQIINVLDSQTREPIEGAELWKNDSFTGITSDSDGVLDISEYKTERELTVKLEGYGATSIKPANFKNNAVLWLHSSATFLSQVVVSASKWQQLNSEVPGRIITLSEEEIAFQNAQTSADLLGSNGGVFIQKSQLGGGSPMIRGFAANRVLISVDGVRMNNAIFRSGNLQNVIALDVNTLDRAEVLLGPGSLIYGSDAIGGVMAFYTRKPDIDSAKVNGWSGGGLLRYSSANDEHTAGARIGYSGKKWGSLTAFSYSDFGDQTMGRFGPDEYLQPEFVRTIANIDEVVTNDEPRKQVGSGYKQYNLMQKFRYQPNKNWDLSYGFHFSNTGNVPRYDRVTQRRNGELRFARWDYGPQTWMMNQLNVLNSRDKGIYNRMNLSVAHQLFKESRISRRLNSVREENQEESVGVFSLNADFEKNINDKNTLRYGLEALFNKVNSEAYEVNINTGEREAVATRYPDDSKWNSYAAYVSHEFKPSSMITLQGGLRYSYVSSRSTFSNDFFDFQFTEGNLETGALNGNLGVVYRPGHKWEFRSLFSTGFRAPNIDDIGKVFDSEPGAVVVPNPDLEYEYAYNGELGISKVFGNQLRINFTGYLTHLTDALVRDDFTFNGQDSIVYQGELSRVQAIQNASWIRVMGLEGEVEWHPTPAWEVRAMVNYQDGDERQEDGDLVNVRHVAPLFGQLSVGYERGKWKARLFANYNGEISYNNLAPSERNKPDLYAIDANGNPYSPSWYTLNWRSSYALNRNVFLSFGIDNLTDQRYRPYSSGIAAAERNFIFAANFMF